MLDYFKNSSTSSSAAPVYVSGVSSSNLFLSVSGSVVCSMNSCTCGSVSACPRENFFN